jgi:hypothetical protein
LIPDGDFVFWAWRFEFSAVYFHKDFAVFDSDFSNNAQQGARLNG